MVWLLTSAKRHRRVLVDRGSSSALPALSPLTNPTPRAVHRPAGHRQETRPTALYVWCGLARWRIYGILSPKREGVPPRAAAGACCVGFGRRACAWATAALLRPRWPRRPDAYTASIGYGHSFIPCGSGQTHDVPARRDADRARSGAAPELRASGHRNGQAPRKGAAVAVACHGRGLSRRSLPGRGAASHPQSDPDPGQDQNCSRRPRRPAPDRPSDACPASWRQRSRSVRIQTL